MVFHKLALKKTVTDLLTLLALACGLVLLCPGCGTYYYEDPDGDADTEPDGDADSDADTDGDADTEPDGDADSDADAEVDAEVDVEPDGDADSDVDADGDLDFEGDADGDMDSFDDADIEADVEADAEVDEEIELGPEASLCVNEFMAANALTMTDEDGNYSDWIELANPTDTDVELEGFGITDDLTDPLKHVLTGGLVLPAHGYLILWADGETELGPTHLGFRLSRGGEQIGLARPDGTYIDRLTYALQEKELSAARQPDCSTEWAIVWNVTPGETNGIGEGEPDPPDDESLPPEIVPEAGDVSEYIYRQDVVLEFDLILSDEAYASLLAEPYVYVEGQITFEGRTLGPVGIRLKAQNSFLPLTSKAAFIVNIDEYVSNAEFFGLTSIVLNNMMDDRTMMHDHMAYFGFRRNGAIAGRQSFATVSVNGVPYGLYSNLEAVDRRMVSRWFADDEGPLFEASDVEMIRPHIPRFELESGPDDRTLLFGVADALALFEPGGAPAAEALEAAAVFANIEQFQEYWANCALVGQYDSMPYARPGDDYLMYADPTTERLWFIPWGMDETFEAPARRFEQVNGLLARTCRADTDCLAGFREEVWASLDVIPDLVTEFDRAAELIAPYVALDPRKPYTTDSVFVNQAAMRAFIATRADAVALQIPAPE